MTVDPVSLPIAGARPSAEALVAENRQLRAQLAALENRISAAQRTRAPTASPRLASHPSLEHFQQVVQHAPVAVWQIRADGIVTLSDGQALAALGMAPGRLVGKNFFEVYADQPKIVDEAKRALAGEEFGDIGEFLGRTFDFSYRPIRDADGRVQFALGLAVDITERVQAEAALKKAHNELEQRVEQRTRELSETNSQLDCEVNERKRAVTALEERNRVLQSILASIADGVCVCDIDGRFIVFNPAAARILGRGPISDQPDAWSEHYGLYLADAETPIPESQLPMVRALRGEVVVEEEIFVLHDELSAPVWLSVNAQPVRDSEGRITGAVAAFRDFTEAKQSRDALNNERRFLEYALAVHERDRQLIAYELHDGLVQEISASLMYLESLALRLTGIDDKSRDDFATVVQMLRDAMQEARLVISGLRPPILDEQGVVAAIEYLVHEQVGFGAPPIAFTHEVSWKRLDSLLEAMLFRIVQEALTNLRTHSQAERGEVTLHEANGRIRLTISDDGVGFSPRKVSENRFGLQGIRKRVALLRGRIDIDSAPGKGTRLTIELPIELGPATVRNP
ncbi:MAG: PAS domain-containing protein [Planctomycetia bacterium]|nr:PAS domain-containing protein [Planctomycetia bacterium]